LRASFRKLFDARRLLVAHFGYAKKKDGICDIDLKRAVFFL
jgi:hypothetical protein